jgi:5-formaminoimidazole-4-carboxamide-1-(beta)-D-ribofuranosyl 5'-monophosphate synthetase
MASIATLGSHCALQVLKGAKDEGLKTILVCEKKRQKLYRRFNFIDELVLVDSFLELLDARCTKVLEKNKAVLVPHGTLIAQMTRKQIESIKTPVFGNKWILKWESDRHLKEKMMREAKLVIPKTVPNPKQIKRLTIAKRHGAAGGKGYFLTTNENDYIRKRNQLIKMGLIKGDKDLYLQEYVMGVLAYLQFFYSPLSNKLEFFGVDKRHESDIEGLARIPSQQQLDMDYVSSFNVIGNSPMVLRESLLDEVYSIGERFVKASKKLAKPGMNGPFCIEGVYDQDGRFWAFEFSARIVAGTNIYMDGSPYSTLLYDVPMSMGRRIAREVKNAEKAKKLDKITT